MAIKNDYQAGTVSIANGSTALTGAGAAMWVAADIQPGDTFKVQNLDAIIAAVNSNTSITLAAPWTGTTLSAAPYRIRYQPDGSRFTAALRDLVAAISGGSVAALQALTGAADKLPYFTGPGAMALADFKAKGRDIAAATDSAAAYAALGIVPDAQLPASLAGHTVFANLNLFNDRSGWGLTNSSTTNQPVATPGIVMNILYTLVSGGYCKQVWYERDGPRSYQRQLIAGTWSAWFQLTGVSSVGPSVGSPSYAVLPSGLIIQGGSSVVTMSAGGTSTIIYPTAFPNGYISVNVTNGDTNAYAFNIIGVRSSTAGQTTVLTSGAAGTARLNWTAIGF